MGHVEKHSLKILEFSLWKLVMTILKPQCLSIIARSTLLGFSMVVPHLPLLRQWQAPLQVLSLIR
jgi:hypothetical protein